MPGHPYSLLQTAALALSLATLPWSAQAFELQGHRGARGLAPKNTLASFARALTIGVTTLELDTAVSKDGVVVISHDRRLNPSITRSANGGWLSEPGPPIRTLNHADLARYDVGRIDPNSKYAKRYPTQVPADGARIPTLADVVALTRRAGNGAVRFNIETKISPDAGDETLPPEAFVDALLKTIRDQGIAARTTIQSFDWRTLLHARARAPEIATVCLTAERSWLNNVQRGQPGPSSWTAGLDIDNAPTLPHLVKQAGCGVWSPYHRDLKPDMLAQAHDLGLQVVTWTVNDAPRMNELIDWGVDGIITDYPDRLRKAAAAKGLALPEPTAVDAGSN